MTQRIRPFAYSVQYACFNFASGMADVAIANFKDKPDDVVLGSSPGTQTKHTTLAVLYELVS